MDYILPFLIGVLCINGLPHFIQGISGNAFQSPFASPPGVGESSALVNVIWGAFNFIAAYAILSYVGFFQLGNNPHTFSFVAGGLLCAIILAIHFGKVRNAK